MLERAFLHCPALEALDAQHSEVPLGAPTRLLAACPALKTLLVQHKGQALQEQPCGPAGQRRQQPRGGRLRAWSSPLHSNIPYDRHLLTVDCDYHNQEEFCSYLSAANSVKKCWDECVLLSLL